MLKFLFGGMLGSIETWLSGVLTELTFLAVCAAGLVFCVFSLVFGGDADGDADADAGGGHDGSDGHEHGPGVLSLRGLSLLAIGFGATGYLVFNYTGKALVASVAGLISGWVFAALCMLMLRSVMKQESNSLIDVESIKGSTGVVMTTIPENGLGEVSLNIDGRELYKIASAQGGVSIPLGTRVRVLEAAGGTVVVEPVISRMPA